MSAWTVIGHVEVGSGGAAEIEFLSIPQTYDDLLLLVSARTTNAATNDNLILIINGVTTNQSRRRLNGTGSAAQSSSSATSIGLQVNGDTSTASTFGNASLYIPNYRASQSKSFSIDGVTETNATEAFTNLIAGLWASNDAITSLELDGDGTDFKQYSSATLYGITKGSSGGVVVS
jgi:hypothetical protein